MAEQLHPTLPVQSRETVNSTHGARREPSSGSRPSTPSSLGGHVADWRLKAVSNSDADEVNHLLLSISVVPKLLEETKNLTALRTKREVIEVALRKMIQQRRVQDMAKLEGSGLIDTDLQQLIQWREAGIES